MERENKEIDLVQDLALEEVLIILLISHVIIILGSLILGWLFTMGD